MANLTRFLVFFLLCALCGTTNATERAPNIIIILADDLGYGDIGVTGNGKIKTPHIDQMAADGVLLNNFYASANVCTPSRAGLLTGRYAIRSGLAYKVIETPDTHGLSVDEYTLAKAAKSKNYATAIIGKWHLGHTKKHWPTQHGFDYFWGVPYSNDQAPFALFKNEIEIEQPVEQGSLTERYTEQTVAFIRKNRHTPFLLFLSHTAPHIPLHVSTKFAGRSEAGLYGDVVETIDWSVGEIFRELERQEIEQDTLVIFTSDNGAWFEGSNGISRKMKGSTWDGGYKVPFIASWQGHIPKNTQAKGLASNLDILPTIVNLIGASIPQDHQFDGVDIWRLMLGDDQKTRQPLLFFDGEDIAAIRTQRWKLVLRDHYRSNYIAFDQVTNMEMFDSPYWLLFDMDDPHPERYSLARENPKILKKLLRHWEQTKSEFEPLRTGPARKRFP